MNKHFIMGGSVGLSFDSIETIEIKDIGFKIEDINSLNNPKDLCPNLEIVVLKNVLIQGDIENNNITHFFSGKNYLFHFDHYFYHQLQQIVCQFDFIKKYVPDLKAVFFDRYANTQSLKAEDFFNSIKDVSFIYQNTGIKDLNTHIYFEDLYRAYLDEAYDNNIYQLRPYNLFFEELYFITDVVTFFPEEMFIEQNFIPVWYTQKFKDNAYCVYNQMDQVSLKMHRERMIKYLKIDNSFHKKIYISREDANKRYENVLQDLNIKHSQSYLDWIKTRIFPEEYCLTKYFKEQGYHIVNFEGMPYIQQLQTLYNATHVAGIIGSGLLNTLICNKNTQVFEIHISKPYYFSYDYVAKVFDLNHKIIDVRFIEDRTDEKIIEEVKKFNV